MQMGAPSTAPNAASLPYAVRLKGGALAWTVASSLLLIVIPSGFFTIGLRVEPRGSPAILVAGVAMLVLAALGIYRLWRLKDPQLQLFAQRLERPGPTGVRVLQRSEIAGVTRTIYSRSGSYFKIVPQPGFGEAIALPASVRSDPVLSAWLSGYPDPDAVAAAADKASILADSRYGDTQGARAAMLARAKRIVIAFSIACAAVGAAIGFLNPPPFAALGLAVACIGAGLLLVSRFDGLVAWIPHAGVRPSPLAALIPAAVLAFRGLRVHLLGAGPIILVAAALGLAAAVLCFQRLSAAVKPVQISIATGLFAAFLAYGATAYVDALPLAPPSHAFVVEVQDKSISHGRSNSYYLHLAAWGDHAPGKVRVSSRLYGQVSVGSTVCLDEYRGDLGVPWFDLKPCTLAPEAPPRG